MRESQTQRERGGGGREMRSMPASELRGRARIGKRSGDREVCVRWGDRKGRKRMRRPPQKRGHFYGAVIRDALLANGV